MQNKIHNMIDTLEIGDRLRCDLKILFDNVDTNDSGIQALETIFIQLRDNENWKDRYEELENDRDISDDLDEANNRIEELESENSHLEKRIEELEKETIFSKSNQQGE